MGETRIQRLDPSRPTAGGGLALTVASRRRALGPALTTAVELQHPVAAGDPNTAVHLSTISVRVIPTVNAVARRWMALQVGPSLAFDLSRGDAPAFSTGAASSPPVTGGPTGGPLGGAAGGPGPMAGATTGPPNGPIGPTGTAATGPPAQATGGPSTASTARAFSAVALSAGVFARWSIRIGRHAQLFAAADVEHRLSYTESSRPVVAPGPSTWRSSLLAGVAFTVAGTSTCSCFADSP